MSQEPSLPLQHPDVAAQDDVRGPDMQVGPDGSTRFRRCCLGFIDLMTATLTAWITVVNTASINNQLVGYQAAGTPVPAGWITAVVAVIVGFGVLSLAGILVGIWNLRGLKTMSPAPLVAAIIYSLLSMAMTAVFLTGTFEPALVLVFLHAVVIFFTARILWHEGYRSFKAL